MHFQQAGAVRKNAQAEVTSAGPGAGDPGAGDPDAGDPDAGYPAGTVDRPHLQPYYPGHKVVVGETHFEIDSPPETVDRRDYRSAELFPEGQIGKRAGETAQPVDKHSAAKTGDTVVGLCCRTTVVRNPRVSRG